MFKRFGLCLATAAAVAMGGASFAASKPNIVLILADDLGWSDVSCYGSKVYQTPNIDRLAAEGMRFTTAYSNCPVCSPSRAAILTGKHPARLRLTDWIPGYNRGMEKNPLDLPDWTKYLDPKEDILPEVLGRAGYVSANIGKWHLGAKEQFSPVNQGFDVNIAGKEFGSPPGYFFPYNEENRTLPELKNGGEPGEYITDRLTTEAIGFMKKNRDKPFFLYLPHYAVHTPLQAKAEKIAAAEKRLAGTDVHTTYAAMIESLDESVGAVMQALDEMKVADNTIFIFTSDNGGLWPKPTSNAPLRAGKGYPYEGGTRVPLIVRYPGVVKAGTENDTPVIGADLFPTLQELAGATRDAAWTEPLYGKSLVSLLKGGEAPKRTTLHWHYPHYWRGRDGRPAGWIRDGDWKLIEYYEDMNVELYNLAEDMREKHDLAKKNPAKADELRKKLHDWRESVDAQMPPRKPGR